MRQLTPVLLALFICGASTCAVEDVATKSRQADASADAYKKLAAVTLENYDPNFNTLYQKGDVVVAGFNFGTGSSREQAATALKYKGIPCVIAGSFSETYKRNAFNNGFVVFECPELVTHLRDTLANHAQTTVGPEIKIDYAKSILSVDGTSFVFPPLSPAAHELIVAGGAENLVASRLRAKASAR